MLNLISNNHEALNSFGFLILSSLILCIVLRLTRQNWLCTYSHTTTIFLLPIISFVITSVISNSIALSLGMVGALSIIRFRNPVRSPLELSLYFFLIANGISASVDIIYSIAVTFFTVTIIYGLFQSDRMIKKIFHKSMFQTSFTEGNITHSLALEFSKEKVELAKNNLIISIVKNNEFTSYLLTGNKKELLETLDVYRNDKNLINYNLKIN
jgi:hypothetical protein